MTSEYDDLLNIIKNVVHSFLSGSPNDGTEHGRRVRLKHPTRSHPSASERRLQVQRCRVLRGEITRFESDFRANNGGREPRTAADRFSLSHVYEEYRALKSSIRDDAARHIQAVFRGHRVRRGLKGGSGSGSGAATAAAAATPAAAAASLSGGTLLEGRPSLSVGPSLPRSQMALAALRDEKASLKRQLRAFDDTFSKSHGRLPTKAEKEHLRPLYTRYHALKTQIEDVDTPAAGSTSSGGGGGGGGVEGAHAVASSLASASGAAGSAAPSTSSSAGPAAAAAGAPPSGPAGGGNVARRLSLGSDSGSGGGEGKERGLESGGEDDEEEGGGGGVGGSSASAAAAAAALAAAIAADPSLPPLLQEKKTLQASLRAFEKEFEAKNGRKVKYVKDIESVKDKYARYKALKGIVKAALTAVAK